MRNAYAKAAAFLAVLAGIGCAMNPYAYVSIPACLLIGAGALCHLYTHQDDEPGSTP